MTQLCLTAYNFPSFTHTTGMTRFLDVAYLNSCNNLQLLSILLCKDGFIDTLCY